LKENIWKVYAKIPNGNFIHYLSEVEIRYIFSNFTNEEKETKIREIFKYLYITVKYDFYYLEELEELNGGKSSPEKILVLIIINIYFNLRLY